MADPHVVAEKLAGYRETLIAQQVAVAESFRDLATGYARLKAVWEGEGARQFEAEWARTEDAFDTYADRIGPLVAQLEERIEALRALEQGMS